VKTKIEISIEIKRGKKGIPNRVEPIQCEREMGKASLTTLDKMIAHLFVIVD